MRVRLHWMPCRSRFSKYHRFPTLVAPAADLMTVASKTSYRDKSKDQVICKGVIAGRHCQAKMSMKGFERANLQVVQDFGLLVSVLCLPMSCLRLPDVAQGQIAEEVHHQL